jgi:hypothetical protein
VVCCEEDCSLLPTTREQPVRVAYGAAQVAPGGNGEVSVPTHRVYKECARRFDTTLVSEWRSTKIYWRNDAVLERVALKRRLEGARGRRADILVRGLLWYSSTTPCDCKFVDRELNAAMNIRRCFLDTA